jgi:hypothetical protein
MMRLALALLTVASVACTRDFSLADAGVKALCRVSSAPPVEEPLELPGGARWVTGERGLRSVDGDGQDLFMTLNDRLARLRVTGGRWTSEQAGPPAACFEVRALPGAFVAVCDAEDGGTDAIFSATDGGWTPVSLDPGRSVRDGAMRALARRSVFAAGPRGVTLGPGTIRPLSPAPVRLLGVVGGANDDDVFVGLLNEGNALRVVAYPPSSIGRPSGPPGTATPVSTVTIPALSEVLFGFFDASGMGFDLRPVFPQPEPPPTMAPPLLLTGFRAPGQSAVVSLPLSLGPGFAFVSAPAGGPQQVRRLFLAFCDATCRAIRVVETDVTGQSELALVRQGDELLVIGESTVRRLRLLDLVPMARSQCEGP